MAPPPLEFRVAVGRPLQESRIAFNPESRFEEKPQFLKDTRPVVIHEPIIELRVFYARVRESFLSIVDVERVQVAHQRATARRQPSRSERHNRPGNHAEVDSRSERQSEGAWKN